MKRKIGKFFEGVFHVLSFPALYVAVNYAVMYSYSVFITVASLDRFVPKKGVRPPNYTYYLIYFEEQLTDLYVGLYNSRLVVLMFAVAVIAAVLYFTHKRRHLETPRKLERLAKTPVWLCALLGAGMFFLLAFIFNMAGYYDFFYAQEELTAGAVALELLCGVILLPVADELIFRNIVLTRLKRFFDIRIALVLQAVIFGLIYQSVSMGIYGFALGLLLGLVYYWFDSIWAALAVHSAHNLCSSILLFVFNNREPKTLPHALIIAGSAIVTASALYILSRKAKKTPVL